MKARSSFFKKVLGRLDRLDVSELRSVLKRLAEEQSFLETLFNTVSDGILVTDQEGRIIYFNEAAAYLFRLRTEQLGQEQIQALLPELQFDRIRQLFKEGGDRSVQQELTLEYPTRRHVEVFVAPLLAEAAVTAGFVFVVRDTTEEVKKTHQAVEAERSEALRLVAASVAHEIGNPLNAIHIHLQLIDRELKKLRAQLEPEKKEGALSFEETERSLSPQQLQGAVDRIERFLNVAKNEINRLDTIITQFLQALRQAPPKIRPASIEAVINETIQLIGPQIHERGLLLERDVPEGLPPVAMDPEQIKQVLLNLIRNSMQATRRGGRITIRSWKESDGIWVEVEDTGGGIPKERMVHIFEPFYTTKRKGSGLGLMIVQRIIREHGGRIEVDSRVGEGTRFRVWLPLYERPVRLLEVGASSQPKALPEGSPLGGGT